MMETPKKIIIAEQDLVETYEKEIDEILEFLGLDPTECMVTDESSIFDFSTCYPESDEPVDDCATYADEVRRWKIWLEQSWSRRFPQVTLGSGKDRYLVRIAMRIRESRRLQ